MGGLASQTGLHLGVSHDYLPKSFDGANDVM